MKLLILSTVWPEPTSSAAGVRILGVAHSFLKKGAKIYWGSTCQDNPFKTELDRLGILTQEIQLNHDSFDEWVKLVQPDVVVYERFIIEEQFSFRVKANCPNAFSILDTSDLHSIRRYRQKNQENNEFNQITLEKLLDEPDFLRELASILRTDLTWVVSYFEKNFLDSISVELKSKVTVLPIDLGIEKAVNDIPFHQRRGLSWIGNFRHLPNLDAVRFLKFELWPEVRKSMPNLELNIYGAYPPKEAMNWNDPKSGFIVHGPAADSRRVLAQSLALIAPLRFGAGVKGKILDAWSVGTPVFSTSIGFEGILPGDQLHHEFNIHGLPLDPPFRRWIDGIKELTSDETRWNQASALANTAFNFSYSRQKIDEMFFESFDRILSALKKGEGRKNWLKEILWLSQFRSTEYFSRWIAEKQKK